MGNQGTTLQCGCVGCGGAEQIGPCTSILLVPVCVRNRRPMHLAVVIANMLIVKRVHTALLLSSSAASGGAQR